MKAAQSQVAAVAALFPGALRKVARAVFGLIWGV